MPSVLTRVWTFLTGMGRVNGPVPMTGEPQFQCWSCRAILPRAGVACPSCGQAPPAS